MTSITISVPVLTWSFHTYSNTAWAAGDADLMVRGCNLLGWFYYYYFKIYWGGIYFWLPVVDGNKKVSCRRQWRRTSRKAATRRFKPSPSPEFFFGEKIFFPFSLHLNLICRETPLDVEKEGGGCGVGGGGGIDLDARQPSKRHFLKPRRRR